MSKFTTSLNTDTVHYYIAFISSFICSLILEIGGKILKNINLIKGDTINKFKGIAKIKFVIRALL